ncbi:MAG: hypothetical protein ABFD07_09905 [Methanobacterium sp.]
MKTAKDYFDLTEEECSILAGCTIGEGLLLFGDERVPIRFESTPTENKIIKGEGCTGTNITPGVEFVFKTEYKWLITEQKMILSDWIDGDRDILLQRGYEKHKVARVNKPGRVVAFFPKGAVVNDKMRIPHIGTMSLDHYASVIQFGALMQDEKFEEITINHNDEEDCKGRKNGKWLALEHEIKGSHTTEQLLDKKRAALEKGMDIRFTCSSADYPFIMGIVGEDYCLQRGAAVADFLHNFGNQEPRTVETLVSDTSEELTEETEALEALD